MIRVPVCGIAATVDVEDCSRLQVWVGGGEEECVHERDGSCELTPHCVGEPESSAAGFRLLPG